MIRLDDGILKLSIVQRRAAITWWIQVNKSAINQYSSFIYSKHTLLMCSAVF